MLPPVAAPFRVGQELELTVDSLAAGGRGVARHDGVVVFVDRALPGRPRAWRASSKVKRRHGEAIAFERLSGGPDRVEAPCPHFGVCGGCRWQDLALRAPARAQAAAGAATRCSASPGCPSPPLEPIVPGRARVRLPQQARVRLDDARRTARRSASTGRPLGGRSSRSRSACSRASAATPCARRSATGRAQQELEAYDQRDEHRLPAAPRRARGRAHGRGALHPRDASPATCPDVEELRGAARRARARRSSASCTPSTTGVAEVAQRHPDARRSSAAAWFEEEISGLRLRVSAGSFLQTNTEMADVLYHDAIEQAGADRRRDRLGPVLRHRLDRARAGGRRAPRDRRRDRRGGDRARARERARRTASRTSSSCARRRQGAARPDRRGAAGARRGRARPAARRHDAEGRAPRGRARRQRIVYVSCNPTTLAGNAPMLAEGGYALTRLRAVRPLPAHAARRVRRALRARPA